MRITRTCASSIVRTSPSSPRVVSRDGTVRDLELAHDVVGEQGDEGAGVERQLAEASAQMAGYADEIVAIGNDQDFEKAEGARPLGQIEPARSGLAEEKLARAAVDDRALATQQVEPDQTIGGVGGFARHGAADIRILIKPEPDVVKVNIVGLEIRDGAGRESFLNTPHRLT